VREIRYAIRSLLRTPAFTIAAILTLSIGIGALINAGWLLMGLVRGGRYKPSPGWGVFALQVLAATALLGAFLLWAAHSFPWIQWRAQGWVRAGAMAGMLAASAAIYFIALVVSGVKLRQFVTR